jgi:hypothetical protein
VCTHSWFTAGSAVDDEDPEDVAQLRAARAQILGVADRIVPGHGPAFTPTEATPR